MYNTSLRIVQDPAEAEDVMQESFLSAFQKIGTYSGSVSFGAWLKKIVINQSLDSVKKKRVPFESLEGDSIRNREEEAGDFIAEIRIEEIRIEEIRDAIMKLPDGYRVVLTLCLIEGYDHEEIGQILNISSSTSRSQYTRGRQKLTALLKEQKHE